MLVERSTAVGTIVICIFTNLHNDGKIKPLRDSKEDNYNETINGTHVDTGHGFVAVWL
jgi:hypothetical protein